MLRTIKVAQATSEERIVTGVYTTLDGYREEVGFRRGLEAARNGVLELLTASERKELEGR